MSIGLGHKYWVHLIKHFYGDLQACIKYMQDNPPKDDAQWYELRPNPTIKKGLTIRCNEYSCDLVEGDKHESR